MGLRRPARTVSAPKAIHFFDHDHTLDHKTGRCHAHKDCRGGPLLRAVWRLAYDGFPDGKWATRSELAERTSKACVCRGFAQLNALGWLSKKAGPDGRLRYRLVARRFNPRSQRYAASRLVPVTHVPGTLKTGSVAHRLYVAAQTADDRPRNSEAWARMLTAGRSTVKVARQILCRLGLVRLRGTQGDLVAAGLTLMATNVRKSMDGKVNPLNMALGTAKPIRHAVGKARTTSLVMERYKAWVAEGSPALGSPDKVELNDAAPILFGYFSELVRCLGDRRPAFKMDDVRQLRDAIFHLLDEMEYNPHTKRRIDALRGDTPFYDFVLLSLEALFTKGFSGFTYRPSVLFRWGVDDGGELINGLDEYAFGAVAHMRRISRGTPDGWRGEILDRLQRSGGTASPQAARALTQEDIDQRMRDQLERERAQCDG